MNFYLQSSLNEHHKRQGHDFSFAQIFGVAEARVNPSGMSEILFGQLKSIPLQPQVPEQSEVDSISRSAASQQLENKEICAKCVQGPGKPFP